MRMFNTRTLQEAYSLAKLHEAFKNDPTTIGAMVGNGFMNKSNRGSHVGSSTKPSIITTNSLERPLNKVSSWNKTNRMPLNLTPKPLADRHRIERTFHIGDKVFFKLQPCKQTSRRHGKVLKLATKFYRPFQVKDRVGKVAYQLELPSTTQIHDIFMCLI